MGNFTNLITNVGPNTTLFQQEVDVIQAVVARVLDSFEPQPTQGTFILDGQKRGESAYCILRFNLEKGCCQLHEETSDDAAAGSIDDILAWPERLAYGYRSNPEYFGQLPSSIYMSIRRKVLVLNTTFGRFLVSFYANSPFPYVRQDMTLLMALAEAFAQMGKEDKILQRSVERVCASAISPDKDAIILVKHMFLDCEDDALRIWRDWHEPANQAGELTLFFE